MEKESAYIPASELSNSGYGRVFWRVSWPDYAPVENILVNVDRLDRLAKLGGMRLLLISSHIGKITQISPEIDSVDKSGVASAAVKGSLSVAKTYKIAKLDPDDRRIPYESQWSDAMVSLNIAEIDERISRMGKLRDPQAWASQLNKDLKAGIRKAAWKSLVSDATRKYMPLVVLAFENAFYGLVALRTGTTFEPSLAEEIGGYPLFSYAVSLSHNSYYGITPLHRPFKYSLIPNPAIDRYIALNGLSRVLPLVKSSASKIKM